MQAILASTYYDTITMIHAEKTVFHAVNGNNIGNFVKFNSGLVPIKKKERIKLT